MPNDSSPSPARTPAPNRALPVGTIIPDSSSPAFPKLPYAKRPDFSAAVRLFVPEAARLFESLFPNYPGCLTTNADTARRFYKAWLRGALTLPNLRLLARFWTSAAQRDVPWRQSHPSRFLDRGKLIGPAIEDCRAEWRHGVDIARQQFDLFEDKEEECGIGIMLRGDLLTARTQLEAWAAEPDRRPIVDFIKLKDFLNLAALCAMLQPAQWDEDREALKAAYPDRIREGLLQLASWKSFVEREQLDPVRLWGVSFTELAAMLDGEHARLSKLVDTAIGND